MTRQKKTRKPGPLGVKSQPKVQRERKEPASGKRPAQVKGKPAGSRHNVQQDNKSVTRDQQSGDPRVGSKRKIDLQAPVSKPEKTALTAQQELEQLENNERLQTLLAALENGDELSRQDQSWVNEKLDRYQGLANELGISDEDDEIEDDEDELEPWQKFENPKDWL